MDEILLSGEERDRLQVLQAAKKGQITQRQAAAELKLSRRWVKKLIRRLRKQGDRGVLHGLKGRPALAIGGFRWPSSIARFTAAPSAGCSRSRYRGRCE